MGKQILVVDNDRFMREFMRDVLTEQGHEVQTATDGLSALEILKEYVPDIIFVDLIMPNISGDKLCRIIRRTPRLKDTYLAIVSATVAEETKDAGDLSADICIPKGPFDQMSSALLDAVDHSNQRSLSSSQEMMMKGSESIHQRRITSELLSVQRHLLTILDNIGEGILELTIDGKIIFANNFAVSLFGGSEVRLLGQQFTDLFDANDQKRIEVLLGEIGSGRPEITDPFVVQINGEPVSLKLLPVVDNTVWSVIVIAVPLHRTVPRP